jgi:peroxiredoxin
VKSYQGVLLGMFFVALLLAPQAARAGEGGKATNFTIRDLQGQYLHLSDYNKQLVLMSFWATWCKPCLTELKHLEKFYQKYKGKGFMVLAVSMDGPESQAKVKPFVQRYKLSFPVVIDKETQIVKLYNPKHAAPFSVMLRQGKIVKTREGFQVSDLEAIENEIKGQLP